MKTKPTSEQIEAEISALKAMKPNVRQESAFGDDHHDAIDGQIETLENRWSEDEVEEEMDGHEENVISSAREAAQWMAGESEDGSPSESWEPLTR